MVCMVVYENRYLNVGMNGERFRYHFCSLENKRFDYRCEEESFSHISVGRRMRRNAEHWNHDAGDH